MAHSYSYDETTNLLVVKFSGPIPYSEDAEAVLTILEDPRIKPSLKILVDRTESSFTASPEEVSSHVGLVGKKMASLGSPRVANVVAADLDFGMIRMFQARADGRLHHDFQVFRSMAEACEWLEVDHNSIDWPSL